MPARWSGSQHAQAPFGDGVESHNYIRLNVQRTMLHELWVDSNGEQAFCKAGPEGAADRRYLQEDAKCVWRVSASSHFEAMTKYYEYMGWGMYESPIAALERKPYQEASHLDANPSTLPEVSLAVRVLYFVLSFLSASSVAGCASMFSVRNVSSFEGSAGYAVVSQWPQWFIGFLLLFWLAYIPLRRQRSYLVNAITLFALLTVPLVFFVLSLL